ncbi:MAG TPA: IS4 family transposase [Micropepsaceae bacterium]|nr:IS4 family transposase [Micropepsaceae bacterium]
MRYCDSIFGRLLEPIDRRWFERIVERHDGDAYIKEFTSWDHLCLLVYAQLSGIEGLRGLVATWNANAHHHYHLGVGDIARSTISDANARRPIAIFKETFSILSTHASRQIRREGDHMLRLIDSTPVPLGELFGWAKSNGRIRGLKLHTLYDPQGDNPIGAEITHANVNDIEIGESFPIEPGATYVMDKAYCKYTWWTAIHDTPATFVTRQKTSSRFRAVRWRKLEQVRGEGFTIIDDAEVRLVSKGDSKLAIPMRRIRLRRDDGGKLTLLTNDMTRAAVAIGALYKLRWQIELLFRWIKQHLKIRSFLGRNDNAVCLQILAAMIAYVLLRLAARASRLTIPLIRLADMLKARLFMRLPLEKIDKPPDVHTSRPKPKHSPDQWEFCYA